MVLRELIASSGGSVILQELHARSRQSIAALTEIRNRGGARRSIANPNYRFTNR